VAANRRYVNVRDFKIAYQQVYGKRSRKRGISRSLYMLSSTCPRSMSEETTRVGIIEDLDLKYKVKEVERGKGYIIFLVFLEMKGAIHEGFRMRKGEVIITKGEVAKHIRDSKIKGVEMAAPPPADSNALVMVRVAEEGSENALKEVLKRTCDYLISRGFLTKS